MIEPPPPISPSVNPTTEPDRTASRGWRRSMFSPSGDHLVWAGRDEAIERLAADHHRDEQGGATHREDVPPAAESGADHGAEDQAALRGPTRAKDAAPAAATMRGTTGCALGADASADPKIRDS